MNRMSKNKPLWYFYAFNVMLGTFFYIILLYERGNLRGGGSFSFIPAVRAGHVPTFSSRFVNG